MRPRGPNKRPRPRALAGALRVKPWPVLVAAVEVAILPGLRDAFKYRDNRPDEEAMRDIAARIERAVTDAIADAFEIEGCE